MTERICPFFFSVPAIGIDVSARLCGGKKTLEADNPYLLTADLPYVTRADMSARVSPEWHATFQNISSCPYDAAEARADQPPARAQGTQSSQRQNTLRHPDTQPMATIGHVRPFASFLQNRLLHISLGVGRILLVILVANPHAHHSPYTYAYGRLRNYASLLLRSWTIC